MSTLKIFRQQIILHLLLVLVVFLQAWKIDSLQPIEHTLSYPPLEEITPQQARSHLEQRVQLLHESHRHLVADIERIILSTEDNHFRAITGQHCSTDKVLGAYSDNTIVIKDSGKDINEWTLHHEIGHHAWNKLTEKKQQSWTLLHQHSTFPLTPYAKINPKEDFAEHIACILTNCNHTMEEEKKEFVLSLI